MKNITITANDSGRRLDRFLRKCLPGASLGEIYKYIRKDVKVGGKRRDQSYMLQEGDVLSLYIPDETLERIAGPCLFPVDLAGTSVSFSASGKKAKRNFSIVYEDADILIADKPFGLLTHGDSREKKNHLANQVKDYLIESRAYDPRLEKVFSPAPANRLDRNTTGLVLFGKTSEAMRELNRMIREDSVHKYYLTIACGIIEAELRLSGSLVKDSTLNKVKVKLCPDAGQDHHAAMPLKEPLLSGTANGTRGSDRTGSADSSGKAIETIVRPLRVLHFDRGLSATLCEVELVTGRTHQIRAHLSAAGHPLAGDSKYAGPSAHNTAAVNRYFRENFGLSTQLLHAARLEFDESPVLTQLSGKSFEAELPRRFSEILRSLDGDIVFRNPDGSGTNRKHS